MFYTAKRSPRTSNYVESGTNGCCSNPVKKRGVFDNSVKVSTIQRKGVRIVFAPDPTSWKKLPAMRLRLDHLNPTIRPSSPSLPSTNLVSTFYGTYHVCDVNGHPSICISNGPGSSVSNMNAPPVLDLTDLRAKYQGWLLTTRMEGDFAGKCLQTMSINHLHQFSINFRNYIVQIQFISNSILILSAAYSLETVMIVRLTLRMIMQNNKHLIRHM
ncbi:uncharacterized protein PADG_11398 [Paracoccidioides brasiliensis Pb18]|uniref:Uncharacterized protein n=1 Tax=Paracoccidioides brasiliensis (strain Pb18) TaxID=502780 RepID=A0A0A0HVZ2_PARBD|nr:uncharacterized protein PADG_11398 [Paracoccidioides brasiliensis Pb18]KGM92568.1 hypothetical protein PADG_11398 [Paracoccidioides brasiliensis Pb18]